MKTSQLLLITLILLIQIPVWGQNEPSLLGIVPLISNRADVEKRFVKIPDVCQCKYESEKFTFAVIYSKGECDKDWNVPIDTVIEISLKPKKKLTLDELNTNSVDFNRSSLNAPSYSIYSIEKGAQYFLNSEDEVNSISLIPTLAQGSNKKLRCKNTPKYIPIKKVYHPIDLTYSEDWAYIISRVYSLCESYAGYNNKKEYALYAIVYFSKDYTKKRQTAFINKLNKEFREILKYLKTDAQNLKIINGGIQPQFKIQGLFLPKDYPPPTPNP